jgi:epoxyqueuosine reductase
LTAGEIRERARACGFELAGVARAAPVAERAWYRDWAAAGYAGEMRYLTDRRATVREDPRSLLPSARSVVSVGKLYNTAGPLSTRFDEAGRAWISRYAWGEDYHHLIRRGLERLDATLRERAGAGYESRICVDTAPLLERSYARQAGLGWIGKNTCLINQRSGSWFFLGELLVSLDIEPGPGDAPPPGRCGTCRRCIEACPTQALVPGPLGYTLDSRRCISYLTIELRGAIPEAHRAAMGRHVFGCDICQDVCPWNRRAPVSGDPAFAPREFAQGGFAPRLKKLAAIAPDEFRSLFQGTPVIRARYSGFLRNVAIAMGNSGLVKYRAPLEALARGTDPLVAEHAKHALETLK